VAEVIFACDAMLGSLARWLRLAGADTRFDPGMSDAALSALARKEGRWLVTCDRLLAAVAGPRAILLAQGTVAEQVSELRRRLPLFVEAAGFLSRCSRCNGVLRAVAREEVAGLVPPYVAAHAPGFKLCEGCGKIYWPGTHTERIVRRLWELFGADSRFTER
jgi:uncharacterized protein with PIN domain